MKKSGILNLLGGRIWIHRYARELSQRCDKSAAYLEKDMIAAKKRNHISFGEYEWTGYYDLDDEQKKTISTLWSRAQLRKKYTKRLYKAVLMDKVIFARVYAAYYGRSYLRSQELTEGTYEAFVKGTKKIVYKPYTKGGGTGIRVLPADTEEEKKSSYEKLKNLSPGIIEQWISQHEKMQNLYPKAVNVVRLYSVCTPAGIYLFAPVLFVAREKEISNGCQDALTAMADIRTGEVLTDAVDQNKLEMHESHPYTGVKFKGFQIPCWEKILMMMEEVVRFTTFISNVGWDVAITPEGPVLIEGNTIPGFNTAQYKEFLKLTGGYGYQPIFDEAVRGVPFADTARYEKVLIKLK